jgi:hypothetical protein
VFTQPSRFVLTSFVQQIINMLFGVRSWCTSQVEHFQYIPVSAPTQFVLQVSEYRTAQEIAKKSHANMWMYGDITKDEAKEFGLGC